MRELRGYLMSLSLLMVVLPAVGCGGDDDDDKAGANTGSGGMTSNPASGGTNAASGGTSASNAGTNASNAGTNASNAGTDGADADTNAGDAGPDVADAGTTGAMVVAPCSEFCAKAAPLNCPGDTQDSCAIECSMYYDNTFCQAELRALIECTAKQAAADFECDDRQEANVKTSLCMTERMAAQICIDNQ